ncbi:MAG: alpha/beta hydrolase [Desulfopila sp.]|jgi:alpha-beta hydrolase superfamily lysophospholipase|nr:alpha/beta hydrolase [Desulfopila sp.]
MRDYTKLDQPDILQYLFIPRQETRPATPPNTHNIDIEVDENIVLGCRLHLHDKASATILFFHGNGETVYDYEDIAQSFCRTGINFFIATYRGYGWSNGTPTVEKMMHDCPSIYSGVQQAMKEFDLRSEALFVMGRSIGSAAAIELCSLYDDSIRGLIIESGFADTLPLLRNLGMESLGEFTGEHEGFGNREKIATIIMPTLILHGAADTLIPVPQAERLQAFSGARTKKFFVIPGADHNGVISSGGELYFTTIKDFIDDITGVSSWRNKRKKYRAER